MAVSSWRPRLIPFAVYIVMLAVIGFVADYSLYAYTAGYALQCGLVLALLIRYRKLTPELNLRFHWLAVPTGLGLLFAWVYLGYLTNILTGEWSGPLPANAHLAEPSTLQKMRDIPALFWTTMVLRLLGMSIVVALFEELFTRSLILRAFHRAKPTAIGFVQFAHDMPIIGEWVMHTRLGQWAAIQPPMFSKQLNETAVGHLTTFAVVFSTLVFMLNHMPRDYLGCIACGVVWCLLLGWTNRAALPASKRLGLGPIVWSHGITNAALWSWTLYIGDWQFL